jgi:hypothetical protein
MYKKYRGTKNTEVQKNTDIQKKKLEYKKISILYNHFKINQRFIW